MSDEQTKQERKTVSKSAWKQAGVHTVRLPSGVYVDIRILDLPALIEAGQIPQNLLDVAIKVAQSGENPTPSVELIKQQREFTDRVVQLSVVNPKLTEEDVADVPYEDKVLLVSIATRERDMDAEYNHIGGLHTSDSFRRFRGLDSGDEDVEGL
jgi:hypothetical protein